MGNWELLNDQSDISLNDRILPLFILLHIVKLHDLFNNPAHDLFNDPSKDSFNDEFKYLSNYPSNDSFNHPSNDVFNNLSNDLRMYFTI